MSVDEITRDNAGVEILRWMKHDSAYLASTQWAKDMVAEFGMEAYGVWWAINEKIAIGMTKDDPRNCSSTEPPELWAAGCWVKKGKFMKIARYLEEVGAIETEFVGKLFKISIKNLLISRDEYTTKAIRSADSVAECPDACPDTCPEQYKDGDAEKDIEKDKNPLNPPDGGLVLSSSYDGPGTQGDKKKVKSKTDKADRASLLADGFGTLDTKRETVPLLKRQRKLGLKDDSVLRAYNLWAKGYGVETLDSLPDHKGFHGASFKGMLINALESSGATIGRKFTPNDIKQVFDKVLAGKTWHKEFESTRGTDVTTWTYLLRPEKLDNAVDSVAKIGVSSGCGNNFAKQQLDAAQEKGLRDMRAAREEDARIMAEVGRA